MKQGQLKAHDYPEVYKGLGLNLATLGCVMLDLEPLDNMHSIETEGHGEALYYAKDKARFWIDGWCADKTPHITLLYGLLQTAKNYKWHIEKVLEGWKLDTVEIEDIGFFESPYEDEPYYCVVAHIKPSAKLVEGNERLEFLPHVNTFSGYKPHMTICYIDKAQGEKYRDDLIAGFKKMWVGKELKVKEKLNLGGDKK